MQLVMLVPHLLCWLSRLSVRLWRHMKDHEGMKAPTSTIKINSWTSWSILFQLGQVQWPRARAFQKGSLCRCKGGNRSNDAHGDSAKKLEAAEQERAAKTCWNAAESRHHGNSWQLGRRHEEEISCMHSNLGSTNQNNNNSNGYYIFHIHIYITTIPKVT